MQGLANAHGPRSQPRILAHLPTGAPSLPCVCRALQTLGLVLGIAGFAIGFVIAGGWDGAFHVHRNLGLAATVLGIAQVGW